MSGFSLLSLYDAILVSILEDWIVDDDLCYLDSASCNQASRSDFLCLLRRVKIVHSNLDKKNHNERFEWVARREMGLRTLDLSGSRWLLHSPVVKSILMTTKRLNHVTLPVGSDFATIVDAYGIDVLSCKLHKESTDEDVLSLITAIPNLTSLDISECECLSETVSRAICYCCPNLQRLDAPLDLNITRVFEGCPSLKEVSGRCEETSISLLGGLTMLSSISTDDDPVILAIANNCPNLTELESYSPLKDSTVVRLVEHIPYLLLCYYSTALQKFRRLQ